MAEQDTWPDEEFTPEGMAEEANHMMKVYSRLVHGEERPFLDFLLGVADLAKTTFPRASTVTMLSSPRSVGW